MGMKRSSQMVVYWQNFTHPTEETMSRVKATMQAFSVGERAEPDQKKHYADVKEFVAEVNVIQRSIGKPTLTIEEGTCNGEVCALIGVNPDAHDGWLPLPPTPSVWNLWTVVAVFLAMLLAVRMFL